jgi:hypothetical protein
MEKEGLLRNRIALAVALGCLCFALLVPALAQGAMFPQCPSVGAATGCDLLITVNPGGALSYQKDPTQSPYSSAGNSLVGVVNDSGATVSSITLLAPGIFAFNGTGAGALAAGGPFGSTGYEGPGTSFSIGNANDGTVTFAGGLANQASLWFSLEGPPYLPTYDVSKNLTTPGSSIDEVKVVLSGLYWLTGPSNYLHPPDTPFNTCTFTQNVPGNTTTFDCKNPSAPIAPGSNISVGFSLAANSADFASVAWFLGGAPVGCGAQLMVTLLTGTGIGLGIYENTAQQCVASVVATGSGLLTWYSLHIPPRELMPGSLPSSPLGSVSIGGAGSLNPGATKNVDVPQPPAGAEFGVLTLTINESGATTTTDVLEFPTSTAPQVSDPPPVPALPLWAVAMTGAALLARRPSPLVSSTRSRPTAAGCPPYP